MRRTGCTPPVASFTTTNRRGVGLSLSHARSRHQAVRIKLGLETQLRLGNLEAKRDWGHAQDYVRAMWLMLQQDTPDDYVIATGQMHSVRQFAEAAFSHLGLDYEKYVVVDPRFFRPTEVEVLLGDPSRAKQMLGWSHTHSFNELVTAMVEEDLQRTSAQAAPQDGVGIGIPAAHHSDQAQGPHPLPTVKIDRSRAA